MITINIPIWPLVFGLGVLARWVSLFGFVWLLGRLKKGEGEDAKV